MHFSSAEHLRATKNRRLDMDDDMGLLDVSYVEEVELDSDEEALIFKDALAGRGSENHLHGGPPLLHVGTALRQLDQRTQEAAEALEAVHEAHNKFSGFFSFFPNPKSARPAVKASEAGVVFPTTAELDAMCKEGRNAVSSINLLQDSEKRLDLVVIPPALIYSRWMAPALRSYIVQQPHIAFNADGKQIFSSYTSAKHFETICSLEQRSGKLCVFLYSDGTQVVKFGERSFHPIVMILANVGEGFPRKERFQLCGFLPVLTTPVLQSLGVKKAEYAKFRARVFQKTLEVIVRTGGMTQHDYDGVLVSPLGADGVVRAFPILAAYIGDRPELLAAVGMKLSHSSDQHHPCRRCSVLGSELGEIQADEPEPDLCDHADLVTEAVYHLAMRTRGKVGKSEEVLQKLSRAEVIPALQECRFFNRAACTPRCSLHTGVLVMENYLLNWVLKLTEKKFGPAGIEMLNERVKLVDRGIAELYQLKKNKGGEWGLSPKVKTAQHKHRALEALRIALRGFFVPALTDDGVIQVLGHWTMLYQLWHAQNFTEDDVDRLQQAVNNFRSAARTVFKNETDFRFITQHELLHIGSDMLFYGRETETSTAHLEALHRFFVKVPFSTSNKLQLTATFVHVLNEFVLTFLSAPLASPGEDGDTEEALARASGGRLVGKGVNITLSHALIQVKGSHPSFEWAKASLKIHQHVSLRPQAENGHMAELNRTVRRHLSYQCLNGKPIYAAEQYHGKERWTVVRHDGKFYMSILLLQCKGFANRSSHLLLARRLEVAEDPVGCFYNMTLVRATSEYKVLVPMAIQETWEPLCCPSEEHSTDTLYYLRPA